MITHSSRRNTSIIMQKVRSNSSVPSVPGLDEYESDAALAAVELLRDYPEPVLRFASACCVLFMLVGIPGNLITIIALARYKKVQNATAVFIINLSSSDLLFCALVLPINVCLYEARAWVLGMILCRVYPLVRYSLTAVSLFTVVAISLNRCVLITYSQYYTKLYGKRNLLIMIISIWILAIGLCMPTWFEKWGRFSLDPNIGYCTIIPDINARSPKIFISLFGFIAPCAVIFLCYARILWVVRKVRYESHNSNNIRTETESSIDVSIAPYSSTEPKCGVPIQETDIVNDSTPRVQNDNESVLEMNKVKSNETVRRFQKNLRATIKRIRGPTKSDRKLRAMIAAIMISFCVCYLPVMLLKTIWGRLSSHHFANIAGYMLVCLSSCINPVIYVVMSSEYRQAYKNLLKSS